MFPKRYNHKNKCIGILCTLIILRLLEEEPFIGYSLTIKIRRQNMLRAMIFVDFENFNINRDNLYKSGNKITPHFDYTKFADNLVNLLQIDITIVKSIYFVPKPDDFLIQDDFYKNKNEWYDSLRSINNISVIESNHIARPAPGLTNQDMKIADKTTYYITEKGTDVNLTAHLLTKGFMNTYDVAIIVSGDTDYIPAIEILNTIGKSVIIVAVKGQVLSKFKKVTDRQVLLDRTFFKKCELAKTKNTSKAKVKTQSVIQAQTKTTDSKLKTIDNTSVKNKTATGKSSIDKKSTTAKKTVTKTTKSTKSTKAKTS